MYDNGQRGLQNYKGVVEWYQKATDQGHAKSQYNRGIVLYNGLDLPQNKNKDRASDGLELEPTRTRTQTNTLPGAVGTRNKGAVGVVSRAERYV